MKNSTELIALARDIVKRELERSIEKDKQPSFYECIYEAYLSGIEDASGIDKKKIQMAQPWHYIELEGCPPEDTKCYVLCQYDGYKETTTGYYVPYKGAWELNWYGRSFEKVIAWHILPEEE